MNTFETILAELKKRVSQLSDTITCPSFLMTTPYDKIEYIKGEIKGLLNSIETVQNLLKDKLNDVSSKDRFFFFVVSYWLNLNTHEKNGKINLFIKSNGFPSKNFVEKELIKIIETQCVPSELEIKLVVENWIEMSEDDYKQFLSKD